MQISQPTRRSFLSLLAAAGVLPQLAIPVAANGNMPPQPELGEAKPFSLDSLITMTRDLASRNYVPGTKVPQEWIDLNYDQYRGINFNPKSAKWRGTDSPFQLEFFAPGLYFPTAVTVDVVEGDQTRPVLFSKDNFVFSQAVPQLQADETLGFSGFRLRANINSNKNKDEFAVFQGASYFRAVARDQVYGLSARGLALNTADPEGEEFPDFRKFWVEKPKAGDTSATVHALLDSPSVAGLYSFIITPGSNTVMDVTAILFPRKELKHVGIAAETSMFLFDESNTSRFDDFRQAVHDSEGLLIINGAGETLWRQLSNPRTLQVSSFVDDNPRGFGLMQRPRDFADYSDLEANYHRRPGLWVLPGENWGKGAVTLVEIPADKEIYDNIVAYWRPRDPLSAGSEHRFTYRLVWCDEAPIAPNLAKVINTRLGKRVHGEGRVAAIDFAPHEDLPEDLSKINVHVSSSMGPVSKGILQRNPATGGVRLSFTFDPGTRTAMGLRAQLMVDGRNASEVWLYRWTA